MKRFLLVLLVCWIAGTSVFGQTIPARPSPPRLVNDFTNTLTADQAAALERKLVAYDDTTSNQIAVVIVPTTNDYAPVDYATKLGRDWGVGNKKNNNGIVLLVVKDSRQIYIATGYGLEGVVPDITARSIIENEIKPNFRADDFYRGLDQGTTAIMKAAAGEYKAPANYARRGIKSKGGGSVMGIIIIVIIIIVLSSSRGGGGGGMASRRGFGDVATGMLLGQLLGGGRRGSGGGFGGGFGGGSSGGSSGGGGGFGGFGGGSFGGGGSGGSW